MTRKPLIVRLYFVYAVLFTATGLILLALKNDLIEYLNYPPLTVLGIAVFILLTGLAFFIMLYVRGDLFPSMKSNTDTETTDIDILKQKINALKKEFEENININVDKGSFEETKQYLDSRINALSEKEIAARLNTGYKEELIRQAKLDLIDKELATTKERIEREAFRLSRYGLINLMIGFITTFMAIFFLGYSLLGVEIKNLHTQEFIYHLIPRLSLSILIEVFSFFFLRLYKNNLDDSKYLNNERTNVEMKIIAIKTGFLNNDNDLIKAVALKLSETERNFVLKKDETTVEVEKSKLELANNNNFISGLIKVLERK